MTNSMSVFTFNSNEVRTFADTNGNPWFLANDVCAVLGYLNPRQTIERHCKDRGVSKRDTPTASGNQEMTYINEGNLYRLIVKSRKPEAEAFEALVMEEILPTIRKTGTYSAPERKTKQVLIGGLTGDQQDAIKALVGSRIDSVPKEKQRSTAMKLWGAVNRKFGTKTYKDIAPSEFTNVLSLIARLPLEGEFIAAPEALPADKVIVSREYLTGLIKMVELQRERFYLVEQAEEQIQYAFNALSVMVSGQMKQANDAVREARYRMHDPLTHAKSYANTLKHQLA